MTESLKPQALARSNELIVCDKNAYQGRENIVYILDFESENHKNKYFVTQKQLRCCVRHAVTSGVTPWGRAQTAC